MADSFKKKKKKITLDADTLCKIHFFNVLLLSICVSGVTPHPISVSNYTQNCFRLKFCRTVTYSRRGWRYKEAVLTVAHYDLEGNAMVTGSSE